ncbi:MAG: serine protein kinase PrkA [Candidatus Krumholzibacteria bacterium]|nr:serine protein kinase PrkA [Candidatus Krumholzibacteria bacterium]
MDPIRKALQDLAASQRGLETGRTLSFEDFLAQLRWRPDRLIRNVHQVFHDMVRAHVGHGHDEYPDDPESINFIAYDFSSLLVEDTDQPFFADRIFANRLMNVIESFRGGAQQNKIYLFNGPPGSGKSIFLNNLLQRFQEYANSPDGIRYETVWRLDRARLGDDGGHTASEQLARLLGEKRTAKLLQDLGAGQRSAPGASYIEVPCPSHDNPIVMIPRDQRAAILDALFASDEFKWNLSTGKQYDWVFSAEPCTICSSLYRALLRKLDDPDAVFSMIFARPYQVNRRLGEGISVYNPGDLRSRQPAQTNLELQRRLDELLPAGSRVRYIYSRYARTNNGIYALMDLKGHNKDRLFELHNIISEGVHKVEEIEESVQSLFLGVMNPEDEQNIGGFQSLKDRIEFIHINYVLESPTEVAIYANTFGRHIHENFLPRVLENFARVIISSRLNENSPALRDWIGDPRKYMLYCDENLHLLKMAMYTGVIPDWLDEEDRKRLTAKRRRQIIAEAENEGSSGFSGRDAIDIFQDLYGAHVREGQLITMDSLVNFFTKVRPELSEKVPKGFLDALRNMYNYQTLQEVKESLFYYNEQQIARDLQNYLFALNFELGTSARCTYTGDKLEITEAFLDGIEDRLLGQEISDERRREFRAETQRVYTSRTLTQEIMLDGKDITDTELYAALRERYVFHLKEKVLEPFLKNINFRRALKDLGSDDFKTYDSKIRTDVRFLITNLCDRFGYNEQSAREVCLYVIDHNLAEEFAG